MKSKRFISKIILKQGVTREAYLTEDDFDTLQQIMSELVNNGKNYNDFIRIGPHIIRISEIACISTDSCTEVDVPD